MLKLVRDHYPFPGGSKGDPEAGPKNGASRKRGLDTKARPRLAAHSTV